MEKLIYRGSGIADAQVLVGRGVQPPERVRAAQGMLANQDTHDWLPPKAKANM